MKPVSAAPWHKALVAVLLVSAALRLALVGLGGQYFFGDERRYNRGIELYQAIRHGEFDKVKAALGRPEHEGFVVIGAVVTALQHLSSQATIYRDWSHPESVIFTMQLGAAFLSLFSVLNIYLVYKIALALGAAGREAFCSAALLALSNSGFYFARHLLPYDGAISFLLSSILFSARRTGAPATNALIAGGFCGAMYHVYNGYWYFLPVLATIHLMIVLQRPAGPRFWLIACFGLSATLALSLPIVIGLAAVGSHYWSTMVAFSNTVTFGLFSEGATLPWEYLTYTESWFGAAVLVCLAVAFFRSLRDSRPLAPRVFIYLTAIVGAYLLLVIFSVGLQKFVVYARTVKPFAVMICLLGGWAFDSVLAILSRTRVYLVILVVLLGLWNWVPHFTMSFPIEVETSVLKSLGNPKHTLSFSGSLYWPLLPIPVSRPDLMLVDAQMIYPVRAPLPLPEGATLFSIYHPLNYKPFQYECHSPRERALLRANPPSIRLIRLKNPADFPDDPPLALRFTAADRPDGHH